MNKRRNKLGFTLAELLIVVAIIGVLVAIAIPVFTSSLEKARAAVCQANRRSLLGLISSTAMTDDNFKKELNKESQQNWDDLKTAYEKTGNSFTDKICPLDGTIEIISHNSSYSVYCTKHPENSSSSERTDWMTNEEKGTAALPSVSAAFEALYGKPGDTSYFKSGGDDYAFMKAYNQAIGTPLTVPTDEALKYFPDTQGFSESPLVWTATRMYFDSSYHDIMLLTPQSNFESDNPKLKGYLFYYDGSYYRSTTTNGNKTLTSTSWLTGGNKNQDKSLEELLDTGALKAWEKVP
ncbi:prepilin-type N-terminal cleavage/methylation domain-containing protein [Agathobaculum sp. NTUH-O15-33]|uniref:type IV pilin protein n=1 Tax=Agathobaculum sp. NTUH-O15-33 TaxID=3079302 RepID=UPI0029583436|nr:prepilin-type N-terminal cleavage/methylation domain-containing protein [Agathobaculum sp. NTUH-O15-33]WNX86308.1 prepilin-type N-terminal cleavage/methylation domain-containing protein [Agathobaculum sp. NTUH-O15-33]